MDVYDYPYLQLLELVNITSTLVISTSKTSSRDLPVTLTSISITAEVMDVDFDALGEDSCKCQFGGECICKSLAKKRKTSAGKEKEGCSSEAGSCGCSSGCCSSSLSKKAKTASTSSIEKSGCCSSKETAIEIVEAKPSCCSSKTPSLGSVKPRIATSLSNRGELVISSDKEVVEKEKCRCGCKIDAITCRECLIDGCDLHFAKMSSMNSLIQ